MALLENKAQARLKELAERLEALESALPAALSTFHGRRLELLSEVRGQGSNWLRRIGEDQLEDLERQVRQVESGVENLRQRLTSATALGKELKELRKRLPLSLDEALRQAVEARCEQIEERLQRVATRTRPEEAGEGDPDVAALREIESDVRHLFQAVFWLGRFEENLAKVEEGLEDLRPIESEVRQTFLDHGASSAWLQEIRRRVKEVEGRLEIEAQRPPELVAVARLLPRLRGWAGVLGRHSDRVKKLEARHRDVVIEDWRSPVPAALKTEAQQLEQELVEQGSEIRQRQLEVFRDRLRELVRFSGAQPDLERRLDEIARRKIPRSQSHKKWLADLDNLRQRMAAIANTHRAELDRHLTASLDEIRAALVHLRADPISDEVALLTRSAEQRAEELAASADAAIALAHLSQSRILLRELAELRQRALAEVQALHADQARLRLENAELVAEGERIGLTTLDLSAQIDELTLATDESSCSLELSRQTATDLAAEMAQAQDRFVSDCGARLAEMVEKMRDLAEVLAESDPRRGPFLPPSLSDVTTPREAVTVLLASQEQLAVFEEGAVALGEGLLARRHEVLTHLERRQAEDLDPAEKEKAEELAAKLESDGSAQAPRTPAELRELLHLLDEVDGFEERLEAEHHAVIARRSTLVQRILELREQGLERLYPRWARRLSALVFGLPENPLPSPETRHQLQLAEDLCQRLRSHLSRLAAREVSDGIATLERGGGPEVAELLAEIEAYRDRTLPPERLRRRLRRALRLQAERRAG